MLADYQEIAERKRKQQLAAIPSEWILDPVPSPESTKDALAYLRTSGLLSESELRITEETDAAVLLGQLSRKEVSATGVIRAFAKRAALAHQMVNCCTEIFLEDAFEQAKKLDEAMEATGKPVGPLHGLPVSLKDSVSVKGHDTTIGEYWIVRDARRAKRH
jgi:amidase